MLRTNPAMPSSPGLKPHEFRKQLILLHGHSMHLVVTAEEIVTYRNDVVKSARGDKKYDYEQERINDALVVFLQCLVERIHDLSLGNLKLGIDVTPIGNSAV